MFRKMLVPLDGSELAERALVYAKELSGRLDLDVILLNVCAPEERALLPMHVAYVKRVAESIRRRSAEVQEKGGIQPGDKLVQAKGEVVVGCATEEIVRYAENNQIDIIMMATHGRSGVRRLAMGRVAEKVLRVSRVPVWLVSSRVSEEVLYDKWPTRTILVPLDGSELAESVLPYVEALAKQRGPDSLGVVLLRVCEYPIFPLDYAEGVPVGWGKQMEQEMSRSKQLAALYLAGLEERLRDQGLMVRSEILEGRADDEIIDYAAQHPFSLIAMATHGRSGISRWAYGSVAQRVLAEVECPLLIIRPQ